MYYYLDKGKYKEKSASTRAKLYITRLQQEGERRFLLQFVVQHLTSAQQGMKGENQSLRCTRTERKNTAIEEVEENAKAER